MKRILYVVVGLGVVGGLGFILLGGSTIEVKNDLQQLASSTSAMVEEQLPEPSPAEKLEAATQELIAEAIAASAEEINTAKEQAARAVEVQMEREIEREVRANLKTENDARITEIDKESGAY